MKVALQIREKYLVHFPDTMNGQMKKSEEIVENKQGI